MHALISAIKGFVGDVKYIVINAFAWVVALVSVLASLAFALITSAIPLAIAIFIALWAYKTFLAD